MSIDITVAGGTKARLLTAGKYCPDDIVVTATGGEVASSWQRPWDWPNYDTMERPTSDVMYYTYDCRVDGGYATFYLPNGAVVSMGQIVDGGFEASETTEVGKNGRYERFLSPELGDYVVFRVLPLEGAVLNVELTKTPQTGPNGAIRKNVCIEIWGRMRDGITFNRWDSYTGGISHSTKAVTLYDFTFGGAISTMYFYAHSLEWANYNDWAFNSLKSSMSSGWRESRLTSFILPATWDTSNITQASYMFMSSQKLSFVDLTKFNTQSLLTCEGMFNNCPALSTVDLRGCDFSNVTNMNTMFSGCYNLVNVYIDIIPVSVSISSEMLSHDSLIRIINALTTVTTTQTLTLGTVNLGKLTDEEKAVATEKGWTLA